MQDETDRTERTMLAHRQPGPPQQHPGQPGSQQQAQPGPHRGGPPNVPGMGASGGAPVLRSSAGLTRSPAEALEPQRAPAAPRGRRIPKQRFVRVGRAIGVLNGIVTFLLMAMVGLGALYFVTRSLFDRPGPLTASKVVVISQGKGLNDIAEMLEKEEVIADRRVFTTAHLWFKSTRSVFGGKQPVLKAGEYEVKKSASVRQVLDTLIDGKSILYKVTVAEGLTSFQILQKLAESQDLTGEVPKVPPEGSLLPDTYKFSRGMSRQELLDRMQAEQQKVLKGLWEKRQQGLPYKTPEEALIMASIIEKETGRADERDRVSAVFTNRLRQRMRLQSDPTIVYGVTLGQGPLGRGILRSEIDTKTAYNTYQIDGLPPTPICNPGRSALEATLNPAKTDELYFVANGQGGHVFAKTLAEHNRNVAAYRATERAAAAAASAVAPVAPAPVAVQAAPAPAQPKAVPARASAAGGAQKAKPVAPPAEPAPAAVQPAEAPLPTRKPKTQP
jgi:UPF0755 protein